MTQPAGGVIGWPKERRKMCARWPTRLALHSCVQLSMVMVMVMAAAQLFTITAAYSCGQWPRHNYNDTCKMEECEQPSRPGNTIYDPPFTNCTHGRFPSVYTLNLLTSCPNATAPGKPTNLQVKIFHTVHIGFVLQVDWDMPSMSANLAGFQVKLDRNVHHVSLKSLRETAVTNGSFRVSFTNKLNQRGRGVWITPMLFAKCFILLNPAPHDIEVTSLPLASEDAMASQTERGTAQVESCYYYDCLKHRGYDVEKSAICPDPHLDTLGRVPMCKCMEQVLTVAAMYKVDNSTVRFNLSWASWSSRDVIDEFQIEAYFENSVSGSCSSNVDDISESVFFTTRSRDAVDFLDIDFNLVDCASVYVDYVDKTCDRPGFVPQGQFFLNPKTAAAPAPATTATMSATSVVTSSTHHPDPDPRADNLSIAVGVAMGGLVLVMLGLGLILYWNFKYKPDWSRNGTKTPVDEPCLSTTESDGVACTVYISYSRFTATCRQQARQLRNALVESHVNAVLDADHIHQHAMADNREAWLDEKILNADYVIVLLDERYPLNLDMTEDTLEAMLSADFDDSFKFTMSEVKRLQAGEYWGRPDFIVPVYIGAATSLQSIVPMMLRMKTVHRLPSDFDVSSPRFRQLVYQLLHVEMAFPLSVTSV